MVIFHPPTPSLAPFRDAVAQAGGWIAIDDEVWQEAFDHELERRYKDASTQADRAEWVRQQVQLVREELAKLQRQADEFDARLASMGVGRPKGEREGGKRRQGQASAQDPVTEATATFPVQLAQDEVDRAQVYDQLIRATVDDAFGERIRHFRKTWLDRGELSWDQALRYLTSPLVTIPPRHDLRSGTSLPRWDEVTVASRIFRQDEVTATGMEELVLTVAGKPWGTYRRPAHAPLDSVTLSTGEVISYWPNSVFDGLHTLAQEIARHVPWVPEHAMLSILTGEAPTIEPLALHYQLRTSTHDWERALITIEAEPWVSVNTVTQAYQEARRLALGRANRHRPRGLAVWRFVEEHHAAPRPTLLDVERKLKTKDPTKNHSLHSIWKAWSSQHPELEKITIMDEWQRWNDAHPAEERFRSYQKFWKALLAGLEYGKRIQQPGYRVPRDAGQTG